MKDELIVEMISVFFSQCQVTVLELFVEVTESSVFLKKFMG